ncbi:MAG: acetoacetate--CoA ligase [Gammaproteobacteria bacterium]|nr:acetoacetate--CoA ligase [Gammaproteobacteria bacterium]
MSSNPIIWQPSQERAESSAMFRFMRQQGHESYRALHQWSIKKPAEFWLACRDFCEIRFDKEAPEVLLRPDNIMDAGWFEGAELNFAAHLLRHQGSEAAIVFCGEDGTRRELSRDELRSAVASLAAALRADGLTAGDRVAGYLPNCPEAVIAMLATTSIGAIWSSCSPDFGVNGVVDRFGQIEPKVLFAPNGYHYNGKVCDSRETANQIIAAMPSLRRAVLVPFVAELEIDLSAHNAVPWDEFRVADAALEFTPVGFTHPLYIMYSSGTTGVPKCIVHGHGGTLLQQSKEHVLHTDVSPADTLFYFTTCGWMMWNWLVCGLGTGARLILFDGAPFSGDGRILWQIAEHERITIFGTSAKYISALQNFEIRPRDEFSLQALKTVLSTGSPLAPESFDYVYDAIGDDLQLASISGGTDILSCFALGNPVLPVRRGELQCQGLGMATEVFSDAGEAVVGEHGELVCTRPFPSTPVGFWNDADGSHYKSAYFERFEGIWAQGDFAEMTANGGLLIHGRSDAVLNPGGVRIGTAEIYRQVEKLDEVEESIAIGQDWQDDVRVVLFVVLKSGMQLNEYLVERIRSTIRENATPRHMPAKVLQVTDIPRTKSGKIVELAVRSVVHGDAVTNTEALANPEALELFRDRPELKS